MYKKILLLQLVFLAAATSHAQTNDKLSFGEQTIFKVSQANETIVIDGKMNESAWQKAEARVVEHYYRIDKPTDKQKWSLRMLWDDKNLYLFYEMEDKFLTARETKRDGKPFFDDCAEIFIIPVPESLDTHIGFELNLFKASNDFVYFNQFYKGYNAVLKTFDPEYEVEVTIDGTLNDNSDEDKGWKMELAIPIANFGALAQFVPVKAGNRWGFMAVRQDRNDLQGNRRSTSTIFPIYDIEKNVHQQERFGLMEFVE